MDKVIKGFAEIIIIIILASLIVGGIGYYAYKNGQVDLFPPQNHTIPPTPNKLANWKTFDGNKFQVSYPPDWILRRPSINDHIIIFSFEPTKDAQKLLQGDGIRLEVYPQEYDQTNGKNFEEVVNLYNKIYMTAPNITRIPDQEVILGGITGIKRKVTVLEKERLFTNYYYFINSNNKIFIITYMLHDLNKNQESTINQILSTFKFIE